MPAYKDGRQWRWRTKIKLRELDEEGRKKRVRLSGTPEINTKEAAMYDERLAIERALNPPPAPAPKKEVPTFRDWFYGTGDPTDVKSEPNGRYWNEWVIGRKNKPSSAESKKSIYRLHLDESFGHLRLDEIKVGEVASFRASLVQAKLSEKSINNILAVLSKPLHYAFDVELIDRVPKVGLFRVQQPEIEFWELEEYARVLAAAKKCGPVEYAATCLAGEGGLRVGEVKALRWREDVDIVAKTITVNQQMRNGVVGTPKGGRRRTVPMTETLYDALRKLDQVREGLVIRNLDGHALNDENQIKNLAYRVCRVAGLPESAWHKLRHTFGTHAAMFGVNPWRLMTWMGHKAMEETMRYVHMAEAHMRELPGPLTAAAAEPSPDRRILRMLGARAQIDWQAQYEGEELCQNGAKSKRAREKSPALSLV